MSKRIAALPALGVIALLFLAAWLRFYHLDGSSLWSDEGNTWALLVRGWGEIATAAAADIHPPGYYWLLKAWTLLVGPTAWGMRSFSALLGVLLVWLIYQLGREGETLFFGTQHGWLAFTAGLVAALNPFQIYYSQEARMYLLLAVASAGLAWTTLRLSRQPRWGWTALIYLVAGWVGLWTHYSFPVVIAALGGGYWAVLWLQRRLTWPALRNFVLLNGLVLLGFLPWLPTAVTRILAWPKGGVAVDTLSALSLTVQMLLFGPTRTLPDPLWPWLLLGAVWPLLGLWLIRRSPQALMLAFWLIAPIGLMLGLGLFSDAFLKFLIIAAPAWSLAVAVPIQSLHNRVRPIGWIATVGAALGLAAFSLPAYYTDPMVRDNYAGVARYVQEIGDPAQDLVILNAPGQQEVWAYYDPGLPVLALPQQRPPDPAATVALLADQVAGRRQIFALFWATDEADPEQLVERWLDQHTFQALESWQGNLRFVAYHQPPALTCQALEPAPRFGEAIRLVESCRATAPEPLVPGESAMIGLRWQTEQPLATRYQVTVQLLDGRNQVIAQRDGEPSGGAAPSDSWPVDFPVTDNHGLWIPFGTPPGDYRLIVALYDPLSGERLLVDQADRLELAPITVAPAPGPPPIAILPLQQRVDRLLGPVRLLGYAQHRKGFAHAPETPLAPGDLVHWTLYWQAPEPLPPDWPRDLTVTLRLGDEIVTAPLAGGSYPTGEWRAGELVRGEFDLRYSGTAASPQLSVDAQTLRLSPLPR